VAQEAEALGFGAFFRSDHYLRMGGDPAGPEALPGPTDSWVTLGALARETTRIRLGTLVTSATIRLPGPLAISVAQVDAMSGGRVELGLGTGWFEEEHTAYGIPFPPLPERFDRLEEQLAIITGLGHAPHPGSGRPLRHRVQRALPHREDLCRGNARPRRRLRGRRARPRQPDPLRHVGRLLRGRRRRVRAPGPSHRPGAQLS
jgi:alkanesulfonate monooxygenase SsuD/methylene tetrahydromethanopterin reductase-like flavin-dependent oxidoreductase (luciferase family)